jgi:hypothetical protein
VRHEHSDTPTHEQTAIMAARLQAMAESGGATAKAMLEAEVRGHLLNLARISLALAGGLTAPDPPAVPKPARFDAIAATMLKLTGWTSVADGTVEAIYRWLFGDVAAFVAGMEMRLEAGLRILEDPTLREVHLPHPDTRRAGAGDAPGDSRAWRADHRVLEAAARYTERRVAWHRRLIHALRPYGDRSTSLGEAVRRAARELGGEQAGRSFEEFAGLVVAAAEARNGAAAE